MGGIILKVIILDIIVAAVIIICTAVNAKKGFAAALVSLVAGIAAVIIAFFVSLPTGNFIGDKIVYPVFRNIFFSEDEHSDGKDEENSGVSGFFEAVGAGIGDIRELIGNLGFDESTDESNLTQEEYETALEQSGDVDGILSEYGISKGDLEGKYDEVTRYGLVKTVAMTMAEGMARGIGRIIAFVIIFIAAWIVLKIVARAFKFLNHVPLVKHVNRFAGAVLGALIGALVCCVIAFAVKAAMPVMTDKTGDGFTAESVNETYLFKYFYNIGR